MVKEDAVTKVKLVEPKIAVEKIVVRIGKRQIELSLEDARTLRSVLDDAFSPKTLRYPSYYPQWYVAPSYSITTSGCTGNTMSNQWSNPQDATKALTS